MTGEGGDTGGRDDAGPVPVRDLMRPASPGADVPEAEADPRWDEPERRFEAEDQVWVARTAGAGAYGTGRTGRARLLAVHFYREGEPERPVREALVPAGRFPHLRPEELRALFEAATPITVLDDEAS